MRTMTRSLWAAAMLGSVLAGPALAADYPTPLAEEPIPNVLTLPSKYPDSWMLVHDFNFVAMLDGRAAIIDLVSETNNLKGVVPISQFGNALASSGSEIYVAETFYSRFTRGERTDAITIWDKASLKPTGEIVLPGGKRGQFVTIKNAFQFTNDEKWGLLFNFTPASSVSVIDLAGRKVLGEIDLPGCSMMYPTGTRGFATMCADGTFTSITLDAAGKVASTVTSEPVNNLDDDPMFMMPAMVGRTAWFLTFKGHIHGFDLSGPVAKDLGKFHIGKAEGGTPEWRPSGWQTITADAAGRLYVLMNPNGREGGHKDGGNEVWVIDPVKKARVLRIALQTPGVSIEATRQASPLLVLARPDGALDVYNATTGSFVRSLGGGITISPMSMSAIQ
jgi:methylamine dehydrogenase heavy chain